MYADTITKQHLVHNYVNMFAVAPIFEMIRPNIKFYLFAIADPHFSPYSTFLVPFPEHIFSSPEPKAHR